MLENVKGIGQKTILKLNKLNIYNINDLINYYPYRYNIYKVSELIANTNITVNAVVSSTPKVVYFRKKLNKLSFDCIINNKLVKTVIYNRAFLAKNININKEVSITGKYNEEKNLFTATDIIFKKRIKEEIEPVYKLVNGISNKTLNKLIINSIHEYTGDYLLPKEITDKYNFLPKKRVMYHIHNPRNIKEFNISKKTLIYEELFNYMLKINYLKIKNYNRKTENKYIIDNDKINKFINSLPFTLTNDQKTAVIDILNDIKHGKKLNRLILGDVGSGKTIVVFILMYINYISGYQSAMMVPIEVLAHQHFESINKIFSDTNINVEILTSSTSVKERKNIINRIAKNEIDIIIGTHSLINDEIVIPNLKLIVTDEQHRFGVNQRNKLENKNKDTNVIYLSATPIPRTLAITIYGDMDISYIKEKPLNNKKVITKKLESKNIKEMLYKIVEEVKKENQVFVIVPTIEESENLNDINDVKEKLNRAFNSKIPIEVIHGQLKNEEKSKIIDNFRNKKIMILVATTVIEVGIDIKDATVIAIFNAERFGLATLHQLRGRVGRSNKQSYAYLISDKKNKRLDILEKENDGFIISEKDFELRSSGDMFGTKQSGEISFKIADIKRDYNILIKAKEDSYDFLQKNKDSLKKYPKIYKEIEKIDYLT